MTSCDTNIYECAYTGDLETLKQQLEQQPSLLTKQDDNARLLIHWAALSGNVELVTYLLECGSPIDPIDDTNSTPLILAASIGRIDVIGVLVKRGANINYRQTASQIK